MNGTFFSEVVNTPFGITLTGTTVAPHLNCIFVGAVGSGLSNGLPFLSSSWSK